MHALPAPFTMCMWFRACIPCSASADRCRGGLSHLHLVEAQHAGGARTALVPAQADVGAALDDAERGLRQDEGVADGRVALALALGLRFI